MEPIPARAAAYRPYAFVEGRNFGPAGCKAGGRTDYLPYVPRIRVQRLPAAAGQDFLYMARTHDRKSDEPSCDCFLCQRKTSRSQRHRSKQRLDPLPRCDLTRTVYAAWTASNQAV